MDHTDLDKLEAEMDLIEAIFNNPSATLDDILGALSRLDEIENQVTISLKNTQRQRLRVIK